MACKKGQTKYFRKPTNNFPAHEVTYILVHLESILSSSITNVSCFPYFIQSCTDCLNFMNPMFFITWFSKVHIISTWVKTYFWKKLFAVFRFSSSQFSLVFFSVYVGTVLMYFCILSQIYQDNRFLGISGPLKISDI